MQISGTDITASPDEINKSDNLSTTAIELGYVNCYKQYSDTDKWWYTKAEADAKFAIISGESSGDFTE